MESPVSPEIKQFVESYIYKKLRSLRKLYLVEIGVIYDLDNNNTLKSTLNKLVEDIDKFKSNLFYFPTISLKGLISALILIIPTAIAVITLLQENELLGVPENAEIYGLLIFFGVYLEFFLVSVCYSLIYKRLLFIFPRYKFQGRFDKWKKMWNAYLGEKIEGTIYEKENKLFNSLKMKKISEGPLEISLFACIFVVALFILEGIAELWGISELRFIREYFNFYNFPNKHQLLIFMFAFLYISIFFLEIIKRKAK